MRGFIGQTMEAITLRSCGADAPAGNANGTEGCIDQASDTSAFTEALTDNYLQLQLKGWHQPNRWVRARVEGVEDGALLGAV